MDQTSGAAGARPGHPVRGAAGSATHGAIRAFHVKRTAEPRPQIDGSKEPHQQCSGQDGRGAFDEFARMIVFTSN